MKRADDCKDTTNPIEELIRPLRGLVIWRKSPTWTCGSAMFCVSSAGPARSAGSSFRVACLGLGLWVSCCGRAGKRERGSRTQPAAKGLPALQAGSCVLFAREALHRGCCKCNRQITAEKIQLFPRTFPPPKPVCRARRFSQQAQLVETEETEILASSAKPQRCSPLKVGRSSCHLCWKGCLAWMASVCCVLIVSNTHCHYAEMFISGNGFPRRKTCVKAGIDLLWSTTGYTGKSVPWWQD